MSLPLTVKMCMNLSHKKKQQQQNKKKTVLGHWWIFGELVEWTFNKGYFAFLTWPAVVSTRNCDC